MKAGDLIEKLAAAIIRQEGQKPDYANPMNLRDAPWIDASLRQYVTRGKAGRFWLPASRQQGIAGGLHLIALRIAQGYSLRRLIYAWAPPEDSNNSAAYVANVAKWTGIADTAAPLDSLIDEPAP
jgi:hypothetical protein